MFISKSKLFPDKKTNHPHFLKQLFVSIPSYSPVYEGFRNFGYRGF